MVDLAKDAALHHLPESLDGGRETLALSDHQQPAAPPGFRRQPGGVKRIGRHRFVEHHVLPGLQRGQRDGSMQVVGQSNGDDVDVGAPQHLAVVGAKIRDVISVGR